MRMGAAGRSTDQADAAAGSRGVVLVRRRLDRGTQVVGPQVQEDEARVELRELEQVLGEPVEAFDLAGARLQELGARIRVVAGGLHEQLVERPQGRQRRPQLVRHVGQEVAAAVAVAPAHLDALLEAVGHRVELDGELAELRGTGPQLGGGDAPREVALGQGPRRVGQLAERCREPAGQRGRNHDRQAQGEETDRGQEAGEVRDRARAGRSMDWPA